MIPFSPSAIQLTGVLMFSTLVSEDLTCIAAGQLIARGEIHPVTGVAVCLLGIFLGDFGLWLVGRLVVRRIITWPRAVQLVNGAVAHRAIVSLHQRVGPITLAARFIPGLRLPTYLAMGAAGVNIASFSAWTFLAALIWTPLIVLLVANLGSAAVAPLEAYFGSNALFVVCAIPTGAAVLRIGTMLLTAIGRAKLVAAISRIWRWEFWPSWPFYLPLVPWIVWLSLRHRGFITITAANPGIPHGGFVGESKHQILSSLHSPHVSETVLIRAGQLDERITKFDRIFADRFPLILKPNAGQRGAGVKLVRTRDQAIEYLRDAQEDLIVQPFHGGPYEAGVFYYRIPGESSGQILSITDKHFSEVIGDGRSTLEQLIWEHPRYRMQAGVFLTRHSNYALRILATGECFRLAFAGNHCQGTMFRDGAHLVTPELERKIDQIAKTFDGFFFGRFDVRYSDVERFKLGEDFTIIELNGVTSESTNLYDPSWSLLRAYSQLFEQWSILFQIGAMNRRNGHRPSSLGQLVREMIGFYSNRKTNLVAD